MAELIGFLASLVAVATAAVALWRYLRSRRPKASARVFYLGELIESTYTQVQLARFEVTGPAGLAKELEDSTEATREIWEVAKDVAHLSEREAADLISLCSPSAQHPVDYAVFVAAAPLYKTWSKIRLLEEQLGLTAAFIDETAALRDSSFKALASDVRRIASCAIGERPQRPESSQHAYRLDRSYQGLAVSLGYARTQVDASAFLVGAALARIEGAAMIATELLKLGEESGSAMTTAIAKVFEPIEAAVKTVRDHASAFGLAKRKLTNLSRREMETAPYVARLQEVHREWRELILYACGLEGA